MKSKIVELIAISLMSLSTGLPVMAQEQVGNGGGEDVEFHKITSEIQSWMKKNLDLGVLEEKLQLQNIKGFQLNTGFSDAVNSATLRFQDEEIIIAGQSRVCGNDVNPNRIVCNRNLWNHQVAGNIKYAIVLHEYLGVAGYERNLMDYSQYPISKNILDYVYEKKIFELGLEKNTAQVIYEIIQYGSEKIILKNEKFAHTIEQGMEFISGIWLDTDKKTEFRISISKILNAQGTFTAFFESPKCKINSIQYSYPSIKSDEEFHRLSKDAESFLSKIISENTSTLGLTRIPNQQQVQHLQEQQFEQAYRQMTFEYPKIIELKNAQLCISD